MKIKKSWIIIGVIIIIVIVGYRSVKTSYNTMKTYRENVTQNWSNIETNYQRRLDLIPNLVNTVKAYAKFEKETLTAVIEARAKATSVSVNAENINPEMIQQFQQAQQGIKSTLGRLLVTIEKYPELKANQNFLNLQAQLEGTENRIANSRRKYNATVKEYNLYMELFPKNIYANIFGFKKKPYFEAQESAEKAPEVSFN
jgi:LemA protein